MSIASRITSIEEHIGNAYDSIKKFGVDTSVINKNIENIANVINDEIYDKLPKVTQSGSEFTLTPVQNGQVDDFKMIGTDLEQNTTKGNQLIDFNNPSYVHSNITWSFENDVLELEGTSGKYIDIHFNILNIISDTSNAGKVIKFGFKTISNMTGSGDRVQINITYNDGTANQYNILVNQYGNISSSYTIPNDVSNIKYATLNIYTNNKITESAGSITIEKPLLYFDNNTDYEPYTGGIPSPNPDYPQEIKVVEGRQVVTDKGKNLFTLENKLIKIGNPVTTGNNQEFTITGEAPYYANVYKIGKIKDYIGKTLTFKAGFVSTSIQANTAYGFISCDSDGNNRVELLRFTFENGFLTGTYTIPNSLDENLTLAVRIYGSSSTSGSTTYTNTQIEINPTATDYEPYHDPVDYNIDLTNDLLKYNKCDFTPTTTSWYFLNGSGSAYGSNIGTKTDIKFPVEINKKYTLRYNISIAPNTFQLCYENENVVATLGKSIGNNTFTFTSDRNGYVIPRVQVNASSQVKITDISVVKGEEDYYDYKLAKIPNTDYKNRIYKNNGNWYYEENVNKKIITTSNSHFKGSDSSGNYYVFSNIINATKNYDDGLSNYFINKKSYPNITNYFAIRDDGTSLMFNTEHATLSEFDEWLSNNNIELWYPLKNPVTTQITNTTLINQLEAISVHTGTNIITISNDNNIIPEIEITRLKELEKLA